MALSLFTFLAGLGVGSFATVLTLALTSQDREANIMTPEEFEQYKREWHETHDEYDDCEPMTISEILFDLEEENA